MLKSVFSSTLKSCGFTVYADKVEGYRTECEEGLFFHHRVAGCRQENPIYSKYHLSNLAGGAIAKQASPKRLTAL